MHSRLLVILAAGQLFVAGCSQQQTNTTSAPSDVAAARQAIEAANARFLQGMMRGDTAAAHLNYADDAIIMMPNEPAWRGRAALAQGFGGFLSQFTLSNASATTQDVMLVGDLAVETGNFQWTLTPKRGKAITDKGKYLTVWKRQADGSWKILRDINNSDLPPAP